MSKIETPIPKPQPSTAESVSQGTNCMKLDLQFFAEKKPEAPKVGVRQTEDQKALLDLARESVKQAKKGNPIMFMYHLNRRGKMLKLITNGIIIQQDIENSIYKGIDGENWYFNFIDSEKSFEEYYDQNIGMSWQDGRYLDCSNDMNFIKGYVKESQKLGIKYRLLLCETTKPLPFWDTETELKLDFLGYDYAYPGGSYYSCIKNDVISCRISEFSTLKLNNYGLLETEEEVISFINQRERLKNQYPPNHFEGGEFTIYKISRIQNEDELFSI